jgi:hypothetical protein
VRDRRADGRAVRPPARGPDPGTVGPSGLVVEGGAEHLLRRPPSQP